MALTSIFNRLCQYRLWCHVRAVLFDVPGPSPSVHFMSHGGVALVKALMATGRFCTARDIGNLFHSRQTSLREISGSDSLHVSVGPGDRFDAHIDKFSPVTDPPGSMFCPNHLSVAALTHLGREVIPIPSVQVFPEPPPPGPRPELTRRQEPDSPPIVGITWRGPRRRTPPRAPRVASPLLSAEAVTRIDRAVKEQVSPDALLPSHVRVRRAKARRALETAGPNEEAALRRTRDAAEQEVQNYPDARQFALDLAERMEQARRRRVAWVKIDLPQYGGGDFSSRRAIAGQIRRIALILRNHLPDNAKNVRTIVIFFGSGNVATREEVKLP